MRDFFIHTRVQPDGTVNTWSHGDEGGRWFSVYKDGAAMGVFEPGSTVGGVENTGWIDLLTGISAFQRHDGEYLVFVEEDYKAKVLPYEWKP